MLARAVARIKAANFEGTPPEESVALRAVVAAAVIVSIVGLVGQDIVSPTVSIVVLAATPAGFLLSWRNRHSRNIPVKFALAAGALISLGDFLRSLVGVDTVEAARAPLAEIFLWVQMLHSFDLPRRRDLHFSLASSATLIALGGSLSLDASFSAYFIPWGMLALAALHLAYRSEVREQFPLAAVPPEPGGRTVLPAIRSSAGVAGLVLAAGGAAFLFLPRTGGAQLTAAQFKLPNFLPVPSGSGVVNPGLPENDSPGEDPADPGPNSYFGFANFVDLRVRAELSDEIVMRVRSPRPAFWRGAVFDSYQQSHWKSSSTRTQKVIGEPAFIPRDAGLGPRTEMLQTFYIEKRQPNLLFHAYRANQVWFPASQIEVTDELSIRLPTLLPPESAYSVLSDVPVPEPGRLTSTAAELPPDLVNRYTTLPADLPGRVRDLAGRIAGAQPTIMGKAEAVQSWLRRNTRYKLDIPPQPRGTDAVDHFLFEDRRGFCEQIASAMVIMLRSEGIPARFVTGYAPGTRNMLSGYFEVRQSDAHSWVEVYFPKVGWIEFDPTHEVPQAEGESAEDSVPGVRILAKAFKFLSGLVPDGFGSGLARAARQVLSAAADSGRALGFTVMAAAAVFAGGSFAIRRLKRRRLLSRLRRRVEGPPDDVAVLAFRLLEEAGSAAGIRRPPSHTPARYVDEIVTAEPAVAREDVDRIVRTLEKRIYAGTDIDETEATAAGRAAERARTALLERPHLP